MFDDMPPKFIPNGDVIHPDKVILAPIGRRNEIAVQENNRYLRLLEYGKNRAVELLGSCKFLVEHYPS